MKYTIEFREKCFNVLKNTKFILPLMKAMDFNNHSLVRNIFEDSLDDKNLIINNEILNKDDIINVNEKIKNKNNRQELYNEFMINYDDLLKIRQNNENFIEN